MWVFLNWILIGKFGVVGGFKKREREKERKDKVVRFVIFGFV